MYIFAKFKKQCPQENPRSNFFFQWRKGKSNYGSMLYYLVGCYFSWHSRCSSVKFADAFFLNGLDAHLLHNENNRRFEEYMHHLTNDEP